MLRRYLMPAMVVAGCGLAFLLTGQTPAPATKSAPKAAAAKTGTTAGKKTAWGDPDLQGTWFVLYDTPLERSAANANKEFLTDEEVAAANGAKGLNPGRNMRTTG